MMAEGPDLPAIEGVRSLEVRWIFPGQLQAAMAPWFGRFPAASESREDAYLLDPHLRGLSVKVRGGGLLEVKVYGGSPGILDVAGRACGRMESWQKWSFPCDPPGQRNDHPAGWRLVRKRRLISVFPPVGADVRAALPGLDEKPGCAVELTQIRMDGTTWWTLGFEATGPASTLRRALETTAALVFADAAPGDVAFGAGNSMSYAEWLGLPPDTGAPQTPERWSWGNGCRTLP
jgi:hypothetical protein